MKLAILGTGFIFNEGALLAKMREIKFSCLKNRSGGSYESFFRYHESYDYFESCNEEETIGSRRYEH